MPIRHRGARTGWLPLAARSAVSCSGRQWTTHHGRAVDRSIVLPGIAAPRRRLAIVDPNRVASISEDSLRRLQLNGFFQCVPVTVRQVSAMRGVVLLRAEYAPGRQPCDCSPATVRDRSCNRACARSGVLIRRIVMSRWLRLACCAVVFSFRFCVAPSFTV